MNRRLLGVLVLVILLQITAVFAAPVVNSFTTKFVYPFHVQIEWDIDSNTNLKNLEIFKDKELIHYEQIIGTKSIGMYQTQNDNRTHTFKIVVYDIANLSAEASQKTEIDDEAPQIVDLGISTISNKKEFIFKTNEPAYCLAGFRIKNMTPISKDYETNHTTKLNFTEGSNNILVRCVDKRENEMDSSVTMTFILDTVKPSKVSNINFSKSDNKLNWVAAVDANGIASYNVGNVNGKLANVNTNSWSMTTNDSIIYISAIDKAGNEGEKEEYNYKRALLLSSNFVPEKETEKVKTVVEKKETTESKPISNTSKIAWIVFGVLAIIFIIWKIYEHKTDRHGLRRYLKHRKQMRDRN